MKSNIIALIIVGMISYSNLSLASLNEGLVAYYPFNGNAKDVSGNQNHGKIHGDMVLSKDRFGKINQAYKFDGVNDYISILDHSSFRFSTFSICSWFNSKRLDNAGRLVEKGASNSYWLFLVSNRVNTGFFSSGYNNLLSSTTIQSGKWYYTCGVYDGNTLKIFIDGQLSNSRIEKKEPLHNNQPITIGWKYNGIKVDYFQGEIDDIRIYNRALSDSEIQELYNEGSTPNTEESVATPEVYINTNSQNIFKDEMLQVFFNTSVLAGMSEKYDVYFSINWDNITLYDNGIDLVSDKKPLFKNIVVPELSTWFEYQKLRYTFPEGVPQTDYVLGLHLVDSKDNVVFENFSSVNYFPEESVFTSLGKSRKMSKVVSSINMQARSKNKKCHLGGIRTDIENTVATELDKATKRSMLALQMGSSFPLEGRLKSVYKGVKGSYNLLKKGKKVCDNVNNFETLFDNYDDNIDIYGLSSEQASNLFAIEMLSSALSIPQGGGVLYSGFDSNDLVNGVKDYYNALNKTASTISSIDNSATIKIKFEQPFHWFLVIPYSTDAVKLEVTVTPVFTYEDGYEFVSLKDVPKNFTDSNNIETKSKYIGKADSDRTSFGNIDYILKTALTRGLYLIKASTENGKEVYRDTIHVIREGQEHTMIIDR